MRSGKYMGLGIALGAGLGANFHNISMGVLAGALLSAAAYRKTARI